MWLPVALAPCFLAAAVASAPAVPVTVRLRGAGLPSSDTVSCLFEAEDGSNTELVLHDDGSAGDLDAGDGTWSGGGVVSAPEVEVTLNATTRHYPVAHVSWAGAGNGQRSLDLLVDGNVLRSSAWSGSATPVPATDEAWGAPFFAVAAGLTVAVAIRGQRWR